MHVSAASLVTVAAALVVAAALGAGVCPLTVQLLALAVVACRALLPAAPLLEHMDAQPGGGPAAGVPPQADKLTHHLRIAGADLAGARAVEDDASGTAFTSDEPNTKADALVLRRRWAGASSEDAGVFDDFTIAATLRLPAAGALSLFRAQGLSGGGELAVVDFAVGPGAPGRRQLSLAYGGETVSADVVATREPVTLIVRRDGGASTATLLQCVHSFTGATEREARELPAGARVTPQVSAPVALAADGVAGGDAELLRLLVWNAALTDGDLDTVCQQGLQAQLMLTPEFVQAQRRRAEAAAAAAASRTRNPYGSDAVQAQCGSVADWTIPGALAAADAACWDAVDTHCRAAPAGPGCECWLPARADTVACRKFRATLSSAT